VNARDVTPKILGYRALVVNSDVRVGDFAYDVALSFAGEQRAHVQRVAAALRRRGIQSFYDDYEKAVLWGRELYEHLDWIYQKAARTACCSSPSTTQRRCGSPMNVAARRLERCNRTRNMYCR
jgi:hypothetical protein